EQTLNGLVYLPDNGRRHNERLEGVPGPATTETLGATFLRFTENAREPPEVVDLPKLSWDAIAGRDEVKQVLRETIEFPFAHADEYKKHNIRPPRGILLYGPSGTGKTHLVYISASTVGDTFVNYNCLQLLYY